MKCQHINKVLDKINNLIGRMNNTDSALYERKGSFIKEEDIKTHLDKKKKIITRQERHEVIHILIGQLDKVLCMISLSDIFDELNSCNCRSELDRKYNNLEDRFNDLQSDLEGKKEELQKEKGKMKNRDMIMRSCDELEQKEK